MSNWEDQTFHSEKHGDCFSVRLIRKGAHISNQPQLCILKDDDWYPVAHFKSHNRAQEYVDYMTEYLGCYQPTEH